MVLNCGRVYTINIDATTIMIAIVADTSKKFKLRPQLQLRTTI